MLDTESRWAPRPQVIRTRWPQRIIGQSGSSRANSPPRRSSGRCPCAAWRSAGPADLAGCDADIGRHEVKVITPGDTARLYHRLSSYTYTPPPYDVPPIDHPLVVQDFVPNDLVRLPPPWKV